MNNERPQDRKTVRPDLCVGAIRPYRQHQRRPADGPAERCSSPGRRISGRLQGSALSHQRGVPRAACRDRRGRTRTRPASRCAACRARCGSCSRWAVCSRPSRSTVRARRRWGSPGLMRAAEPSRCDMPVARSARSCSTRRTRSRRRRSSRSPRLQQIAAMAGHADLSDHHRPRSGSDPAQRTGCGFAVDAGLGVATVCSACARALSAPVIFCTGRLHGDLSRSFAVRAAGGRFRAGIRHDGRRRPDASRHRAAAAAAASAAAARDRRSRHRGGRPQPRGARRALQPWPFQWRNDQSRTIASWPASRSRP